MSAMLLYIFYQYSDYGPQDVRATIDKAKALRILDDVAQYADRKQLAVNLINAGAPGEIELTPGWGGYCMDVLELE